MPQRTHLSLFIGIGGLDLAAEALPDIPGCDAGNGKGGVT